MELSQHHEGFDLELGGARAESATGLTLPLFLYLVKYNGLLVSCLLFFFHLIVSS